MNVSRENITKCHVFVTKCHTFVTKCYPFVVNFWKKNEKKKNEIYVTKMSRNATFLSRNVTLEKLKCKLKKKQFFVYDNFENVY